MNTKKNELMSQYAIKEQKIGPYAFQQWGHGQEIVVYLHGWQDNGNSFLPLQPFTNPAQRHIAVDFLGHGRSDWKSPDSYYYFIDYVYDLKCFLEALEIETCHLVGHSMGAMVANLFAACYPKRCDSLALIEGIGIVCSSESQTQQQLINAFTSRDKLNTAKPRAYDSLEVLAKVRAKVGDIDSEAAKILMQRNTQATSQGVELLTDPRLKHHSGFRYSLPQAKAALGNINTATLFIAAEQGFNMITGQLNQFRGCFSDLSIEKVPGGHHCHMENPEICYKLIAKHQAQLENSNTGME